MPIRVLVADGYPVCRIGIRALLQRDPAIQIVGEAGDGEEAVRLALELRPDLLLLESMLPKQDGITALRKIHAVLPGLRGIFLSSCRAPDSIEEAFAAGAAAYFLKEEELSELAAFVVAVCRGTQVPQPRLPLTPNARQAAARVEQGPEAAIRRLTQREREVVRWIVGGHTSKQIGLRLGIEARTIETHTMNIKKKLGVKTRAGIIRMGILAHLGENDAPGDPPPAASSPI